VSYLKQQRRLPASDPPQKSLDLTDSDDEDDVYDDNDNGDSHAPLHGHVNTKNTTTKKKPVEVLQHLQNYGLYNAKLPKLGGLNIFIAAPT